MADDNEWQKLPTEEKCVHKVWKARVAGYQEAVKVFQMADDKKSPEFSKFLGIVKKFVVDNNAIAQEKGLDAVLAFVENGAVAGRAAGEICNGVITKCLNSSRAKTRETGIEILLMYIEIEKQDVVMEALMTGLTNKQPKVVSGCVLTLRRALSEFGSKIIPIRPLVKQIQKLLEERDKTVRDEGKLLVIEIYRWIGGALKPQLSSLKPVQMSELEAEFKNTVPGSAHQTRFLRSQQALKPKSEEQMAAPAGSTVVADDGVGMAEDVDPYDLMDPVEILSKLPKDYYEKIDSKKWQERKEALEAVQRLVENPKLEQGDYHDLVKTLKKVIAKDANILLVALAAKDIAGLANGLKKKFSIHAPGCIDVILEKFKEKKPNVVAALREAIDTSFHSTTLDAIQEMCIEALNQKTPSVKSETAFFLARCFSHCIPATLPKKILKGYVAILLKTINDSSPEVREASYNALGTAMKVVGEKPISPFLQTVDNIKLAKIKDYCEKAVLISKNEQQRGNGGSRVAPAAESVAAKKQAANSAQKQKAVQIKISQSKGTSAKKGVKGKKSNPMGKKENLENHLCDEAVEEKAAELLPADVVTGLASSNWKERLAAVERFMEVLKDTSKENIPAQVCIRVLMRKPGLKDNNFQVLKLKLELISYLASNAKFSKTTASYCLGDMIDKIGDVKNGSTVQEALSCIAEVTTLEHVSEEVLTLAFVQKNPKIQSEALNWLAKTIKEFGLKINVKLLIESLKKGLSAANPAVRTATISLIGVMYMYIGAPVRVYFESEKAALLQQIDDEITKIKGEKPPPPTRGLTPGSQADQLEDTQDWEEDPVDVKVVDLVPRNNISDKLTEEIIEQMADKNWKVRKEALEKVAGILNEAKFITPNIGQLPEALKLRLSDSNKILVTSALSICQTLATSMGPNIKQHIHTIGPGIVNCLGDSKPALRQTSVSTLNAWIDQTGQAGFVLFIEAEIFSNALKLENPFLRTELLGWLAEKLPNYHKLPNELNLCTPYLFSCLEDRNADVRKKANESVVPFMIHAGYDHMVKQTSKLKPSSKDQIMKILETARSNLPKKDTKVKPNSAKSVQFSDRMTEAVADHSTLPPTPVPVPASVPSKTKVVNKKKPAAATKTKFDAEETSPHLTMAGKSKVDRFKDEKSLKALKWNFTAPRPEYVDQLRQQMEPSFSKTLIEYLFHADFKFHIKGIDILLKSLEDVDTTKANLDLILKWVTLRFFDTNTSVLLKSLDYLQAVFNLLSSEDYHLLEPEAASFLPYLINKVGDSKDNVRKSVFEILKIICKVYPASKLFNYVIDGMKSKNSKQRTECLNELGYLIDVYGITVCQPSPAQALKVTAQQISDRDNNVRVAALNVIVSAYNILGETLYKYIGSLNEREASMLEERIKRSSCDIQESATVCHSEYSTSSFEDKPKKYPFQLTKVLGEKIDNDQSEITKKQNNIGYVPEKQLEHAPESTHIDPDLFAPFKTVERTSAHQSASSIKPLDELSDSQSALDLVISQVGSSDINVSMLALSQIDSILKDDEKALGMLAHVDQLLLDCSMQLRMTYSGNPTEGESHREAVIQLYRNLSCTLNTMFQCKKLAQEASTNVLHDLIHNVLTVLVDNGLNELEEAEHVLRSLNILVVKMLENCDYTAGISALLQLLRESVAKETVSPRFLELVMKGLWKMVRILEKVDYEIRVDQIIFDLHLFLQAFPTTSWKQRPDDVPLRTVKTILHALMRYRGHKIVEDLQYIDCRNSEVEYYLHKLLKKLPPKADYAKTGLEKTVSANDQLHKQRNEAAKSKTEMSKNTHDMLAEIFKKIGSKENTREGLNELYDFKLKYPEASLQPFMKKSSEFFQSYIERSLKTLEIERATLATNSTNSTVNPQQPNLDSQQWNSSPPNNSSEGSMEFSKILVSKSVDITNLKSNTELTTEMNLADLKRRLDQIKAQSNKN